MMSIDWPNFNGGPSAWSSASRCGRARTRVRWLGGEPAARRLGHGPRRSAFDDWATVAQVLSVSVGVLERGVGARRLALYVRKRALEAVPRGHIFAATARGDFGAPKELRDGLELSLESRLACESPTCGRKSSADDDESAPSRTGATRTAPKVLDMTGAVGLAKIGLALELTLERPRTRAGKRDPSAERGLLGAGNTSDPSKATLFRNAKAALSSPGASSKATSSVRSVEHWASLSRRQVPSSRTADDECAAALCARG